MNDNTDTAVTDLLQRATRELTPDVADLLERTTAGGRRTRRRHLTATALAATVVLAGSAAVAPAIVDSMSGGGSGGAGFAADPPPGRRQIAVEPNQLAQTLSGLLPGEDPRTDLANRVNEVDGVVSGTLTWHGAEIFVGIDAAADPITEDPGGSYTTGPSPAPRPAPTTPEDWCRAMSEGCHELPDGDWAYSNDTAEPGNPANFQTTFALYTTDGYLIYAQVNGLPDRDQRQAQQSPLSVAQVRGIVENDVWLTR